jgi:hypothetical protein
MDTEKKPVQDTSLQGVKTVELYKLIWSNVDKIVIFSG